MTFYFGFSTKNQAHLAIDRRRIDESGDPDDSSPKLLRVNEWTYMAGAGLLYFVDLIGQAAPSAFGSDQKRLADLTTDCPRWAGQFGAAFADHVAKAPNVSADVPVRLQFCGMSTTKPYSFAWTASHGLEPLQQGEHAFHMPVFTSEQKNLELRNLVNKANGAAHRDDTTAMLDAASAVFAWVATQDSDVSPVADLVVVGNDGSTVHALG